MKLYEVRLQHFGYLHTSPLQQAFRGWNFIASSACPECLGTARIRVTNLYQEDVLPNFRNYINISNTIQTKNYLQVLCG